MAMGDSLRYQWFKNGTAITDANSAILTVRDPGSYRIIASNGLSGCSAEASTEIKLVNSSLKAVASAPDIKCGSKESSITVEVSEGTAPYQYSIDGGVSFQDRNIFDGYPVGTYRVIVKDAVGCTAETAVEIKSLTSAITLEVNTPKLPCSEVTGTIYVHASNGVQPYTYSLDGGLFVTSSVFNNIPAGKHTAIVKDAEGCTSEASAIIEQNGSVPELVISEPVSVCAPGTVNLTSQLVTTGSSNGLTFSYWKDASATIPLTDASAVSQSGVYYIKAMSTSGCQAVKPVQVQIKEAPELAVKEPTPLCLNGGFDLTNPQITAGSSSGLSFSYWTDPAATEVLANATAVGTGTYYIKAVNAEGCYSIKPLQVIINPLPGATIRAADSICIGLSTPVQIQLTGSAPWSITYSDGNTLKVINEINTAAYSIAVSPAVTTTFQLVSISDRYCVNNAPGVNKTVFVTKPVSGIRLPDVTATANTAVTLYSRNLGLQYRSHWSPETGLSSASSVNPVFKYDEGMEYFIEMKSEVGCTTVDTLLVEIAADTDPGLAPQLHVPKAWTPNGDGHNDELRPYTVNIKELKYFRIFNRWGQLVYETHELGKGWNGIFKGQPQPSDAYTWIVQGIGIDGSVITKTGNSALLR
jgi:gliding motility-associated-like protein